MSAEAGRKGLLLNAESPQAKDFLSGKKKSTLFRPLLRSVVSAHPASGRRAPCWQNVMCMQMRAVPFDRSAHVIVSQKIPFFYWRRKAGCEVTFVKAPLAFVPFTATRCRCRLENREHYAEAHVMLLILSKWLLTAKPTCLPTLPREYTFQNNTFKLHVSHVLILVQNCSQPLIKNHHSESMRSSAMVRQPPSQARRPAGS